MSNIELKVKIKSLASETKIIKQEEQKLLKHLRLQREYDPNQPKDFVNLNDIQHLIAREGLYAHRKNVVRPESRHTNLAYGFLQGKKTYKQIENTCRTIPDWDSVEKMVVRFSPEDYRVLKQKLEEWCYA